MTIRQEPPATIPADRQERQGRQRQQRQDISQEDFNQNVFVNCPFDSDYLPLLRPLLFTLLFLGFRPRLASERLDSLESRIEKISELICCSRYSVHDLSRLRAAEAGELYRLNMPFELGIEYGCRFLGGGMLSQKLCLILEKDPHEYQKALSDLSGIDIRHHDNDELNMVRVIRNWFRDMVELSIRFNRKRDELEALQAESSRLAETQQQMVDFVRSLQPALREAHEPQLLQNYLAHQGRLDALRQQISDQGVQLAEHRMQLIVASAEAAHRLGGAINGVIISIRRELGFELTDEEYSNVVDQGSSRAREILHERFARWKEEFGPAPLINARRVALSSAKAAGGGATGP